MDVQVIDPRDDEAVARWATQLAVPEARLRAAVAATGTDLDKVKLWLATHPAPDASPPASPSR